MMRSSTLAAVGPGWTDHMNGRGPEEGTGELRMDIRQEQRF
jgi:hypothetical protein